MEAEEDQKKQCGYLCIVLTTTTPNPLLKFLSECEIFNDGDRIGFECVNSGVFLSAFESEDEEEQKHKTRAVADNKRNRTRYKNCTSGGRKRKGKSVVRKKRRKGVVEQIHALISHRCVDVVARVVHVECGEDDGDCASSARVRVVVLVDVYVPNSVWSGWQFPKSSASIAVALFTHLSCDWEKRNLILASEGSFFRDFGAHKESIWNLSDCNVLGCKLHSHVLSSSNKRCFDLHDIFNSLPSLANKETFYYSRVEPADNIYHSSGIWDLTNDLLIKILNVLGPMDLVRVAATCTHLRSLAASITPCMKLKLYPHQKAAVEWMLERERNPQLLPHPLYACFTTEEGFAFYLNTNSGEIVTASAPTVRDFRGGMFCDEPGLGKTITALSLILKTQGTVADPPNGVHVKWCSHNNDQRCGYYELIGDSSPSTKSSGKRSMSLTARRGQLLLDLGQAHHKSKRPRLSDSNQQVVGFGNTCIIEETKSAPAPCAASVVRVVRCTRSLNRIKKNLLHAFDETSEISNKGDIQKPPKKMRGSNGAINVTPNHEFNKSGKKVTEDDSVCNENWVQCDACRKWRKLIGTVPDDIAAWFCSLNTDPAHQNCSSPEESWNDFESITDLPGFCPKGTSVVKEQNVSFFISVLKDNCSILNSKTKKALNWLAKLSPERLAQMESIGLAGPALGTCSVSGDGNARGFHKIFRAFGLRRRIEKGTTRWYYPNSLNNLEFDLAALRVALAEPWDSVRLYLSRATLIVVPANLVDHWKTQILKHVKPSQLRFCIWTDHKKPPAHCLAWNYDVVITTFSRLSAEWGPKKKSPLMQVHWLRVMLDEGHTLGSSLNLTNKLQMAISITATNRWLLTGTPTPNTPNSQVSHLLPMLKFLHEEAYSPSQKSWEAGILRPFVAKTEEGFLRLLQLLGRCMISARKADLKTIPPCIKKTIFLDFAEEHARSYNELVVTVRRNILMADWNDSSHVESLLNPKQWKFRTATIRNVRLSCCVAGHIRVTDAGEDIQETMDVLVENGLDPMSEEYALIKYCLQYGGNCLRCKVWCRLPIITPCQHLLCLDCVALNSERCTLPGCNYSYEMQTPETLARPENPNPKWPVPKDLIELQPSYKQDDWNPDWQSTSSTKVSYLVQRLKALEESTSNCYMEGANIMDSEREHFPWQTSDSRVSLLPDCSQQSSKSYKIASEKVIIFSQFLEHIHVIEQQLTFAGIKYAGLYSPMHSSNKMKSLATFQNDPACMALLMDGSVALGLDLSFVTHVFLMEPIWDRSMEEQVISRAHRMGATRPIHVETLAMRGTIEEQMLKFLQDNDEFMRLVTETAKPAGDEPRPHRSLHDFAETDYLLRLSFARTGPVAKA